MRFQNGSNKVVIELRVVQFWSEIILVISNHAYDFRPSCTPLSSITIINRSPENQAYCKDNQWFQNGCNKALNVSPRRSSFSLGCQLTVKRKFPCQKQYWLVMNNCSVYLSNFMFLENCFVVFLKSWHFQRNTNANASELVTSCFQISWLTNRTVKKRLPWQM